VIVKIERNSFSEVVINFGFLAPNMRRTFSLWSLQSTVKNSKYHVSDTSGGANAHDSGNRLYLLQISLHPAIKNPRY